MESTVGRVGRAPYKAEPANPQEETPRQAGMRGSPTTGNPGTPDKVAAASKKVLEAHPFKSFWGTFGGALT